MEITPPKYVKTVLRTLAGHGYPCCIVGGCVRDMIMGNDPNDWDVATAARPETVMELFPDSIPTGIKHGTVTVKVGSKHVEVTTFRTEGSYADHRHPDEVSFVGDMNEDLSRRDFTINAIAVGADGRITDPFGGIEDIEAGVIRCVGEADKRFEEDALRMLRAFRFSSRLGFIIDGGTYSAIVKNAPLCRGLSSERVRDEIEKVLLTRSPETVYDMIDCGLLDRYLKKHMSRSDALRCIKSMPKKPLPRWATLCIALEADECIDNTEAFLRDLRLDGRTIRCCGICSNLIKLPAPENKVEWKKLLSKYGFDTVECAAMCMDAIYDTDIYLNSVKKVMKSGECFSLKHLAVNGADLAEIGYKGKELGAMLAFLLDYVIEYPEHNDKSKLLSMVINTDD